MGWVGWTEEQTLATDMQSIEIAYRGRHEMLQALAGKEVAPAKVETQDKIQRVAMTPQLFTAIFGAK